jgi:hypothetical protein
MKIINTLLLCLAATLATSQAQVIYDNFSGPAGPLASSSSASLWNISPGDSATLDGLGNLVTGSNMDIKSTATFDVTSVNRFQFKSYDRGSFFGGMAMIFAGSGTGHGLYIRNDINNWQLWALGNGGAKAGAIFIPESQEALWEIQYDTVTKNASAFQNGTLVSSISGVDFNTTSAQFYLFNYGENGANAGTSYQYVATVPEPSTVCLMALAVGTLIVAGIRKKRRA